MTAPVPSVSVYSSSTVDPPWIPGMSLAGSDADGGAFAGGDALCLAGGTAGATSTVNASRATARKVVMKEPLYPFATCRLSAPGRAREEQHAHGIFPISC